ncbi:MAG: insecticidal toxin complex protein, partial [Bacteroidota bacterium]
FKIWESCKRKTIYRENWIEWEALEEAQKTEGFQFLESRLRSATLTVPVPGSLAYWEGDRPKEHHGISLLQNKDTSTMQLLQPGPEGLGIMGTPDRDARPTWLAPLNQESTLIPPSDNPNVAGITAAEIPPTTDSKNDLPLWIQAAIRLGTKFVRVAAAAIPPSSTLPKGGCFKEDTSICCTSCNHSSPALMDEYYFWIEPSEGYNNIDQNADWGVAENNGLSDWHREENVKKLLRWGSQKAVKLKWTKIHHGEFQPPRQSYEIVHISGDGEPELVFEGRINDSLHFSISNGIVPTGYDVSASAGFRYDIPTDAALRMPQLSAEGVDAPEEGEPGTGLSAFPFFIWYDKGAPLLPHNWFGPSIAVAGHLRSHCRFEPALKWYEMFYAPLSRDNSWIKCIEENEVPGVTFDNAEFPVFIANDCCCASKKVEDDVALNRSLLLHYLETLNQWGESLMRKNTPEAFQHARLIFETACKILGPKPISVKGSGKSDTIISLRNFEPKCAPINERLLCLYNKTKDSIDLVHHCINASRLKNGRPNKDMPYFGNNNLLDCWKSDLDACAEKSDWCLPQSPYRFVVLIQKAKEIVSELKSLGAALLAAYEKGDSEYLMALRTKHERQLLELSLEIRKNQWREADWQVQALVKTKEIAILRRQYFVELIANGLKNGEIQYDSLTLLSMGFRTAGNTAEIGASVASLIPDIFVGFPCTLTQPPVGTKLAEAIFVTTARIMNALGERFSTYGGLELTRAGWDRREDEWQHQVQVLDIEIDQIERQILAADRRRDIALQELNNHQQQLENIEEVHDFLRDKFTKHGLYLWIQQETAALHYKMYELGLHCAKQAQRAFNYERGYTARKFIPNHIWDNLREGLLSGERLQLALTQMEKAYYDENTREYELTKHISFRDSFPMSFLQLQTTGYCEIDIPEWIFDHDYPGHFMRRIKNVSLSIPCVVGPYTGVHAKLTLLSSKTR